MWDLGERDTIRGVPIREMRYIYVYIYTYMDVLQGIYSFQL